MKGLKCLDDAPEQLNLRSKTGFWSPRNLTLADRTTKIAHQAAEWVPNKNQRYVMINLDMGEF